MDGEVDRRDVTKIFEQSLELQEALSVIENSTERRKCIEEYIFTIRTSCPLKCEDFGKGKCQLLGDNMSLSLKLQ